MKKEQVLRTREDYLFGKYLLPYFISFVIPVIMLVIVLLIGFSRILEDSNNDYSLKVLNSVMTSVDSRVDDLYRIYMQVIENKAIKEAMSSDRVYLQISAINSLHNIKSPNSFLDEIYVYKYKSNHLISSSGIYNTKYFGKDIYIYQNLNHDEFYKILSSVRHATVWPSTAIFSDKTPGGYCNNYVIFLIPFPFGAENPKGVVMFHIHERKFHKIVKNIVGDEDSGIIILDDNLTPIIQFGNSIIFKHLQKDISINDIPYHGTVTVNGTKYLTAGVMSSDTKWKYIVFVPQNKAIEVLFQPAKIFVCGFTLILIFSILLVYFLAKYNYRPLSEIICVIKDIFKGSEHKHQSALSTITQAVYRMNDMINTLQNEITVIKPEIKNITLMKLLKGHFKDMEVLGEVCRQNKIEFINGMFLVMVLLYKPRSSSSNGNNIGERIINFIEGLANDTVKIYGVEDIENNKLIFIINFKENNFNILNFMQYVKKGIDEEYSIESTIGLGNMYRGAEYIDKSYLEALSSIDYRFIKGNNTLIDYSELKALIRNIEYNPKAKIDKLMKKIRIGQEMEVMEIIVEIFNEIKLCKLPLFYVKFIYYEIISKVVKLADIEIKSLKGFETKYFDISILAQCETIDELSLYIAKICLFVCAAMKMYMNYELNIKIKQMIEYILENYLNYDFCLHNMAYKFNLSVPGISNFFKSCTEYNISDYVNKLRMEYAKEMLTNTDCTLKEIVQKIGYINVSSFIRRFKQYTGMTPGRYRERMSC